jgi:hypothetical protein
MIATCTAPRLFDALWLCKRLCHQVNHARCTLHFCCCCCCCIVRAATSVAFHQLVCATFLSSTAQLLCCAPLLPPPSGSHCCVAEHTNHRSTRHTFSPSHSAAASYILAAPVSSHQWLSRRAAITMAAQRQKAACHSLALHTAIAMAISSAAAAAAASASYWFNKCMMAPAAAEGRLPLLGPENSNAAAVAGSRRILCYSK